MDGGTGNGESDDGGAFDFSECTSELGSMSLDDPVSWVTGLGGFAVWGVKWLFEPSASDWRNLTDQFDINSTAPTVGASSASQWLGAGVS